MRAAMFLAPLPLLLIGCATTPAERDREAADQARTQTKLDAALAGYHPGRELTCIQHRDFTDTKRFGQTILYYVGRNTIYRTDTGQGCADALDRDDIIVTQSTIGDYCRGQIITMIDRTSHFQTGACTFGSFVPYTK